MLNPFPIVCSSTLYTKEVADNHMKLVVDLKLDHAPLTTGPDLRQYSRRDFIFNEPAIEFRRPADSTFIVIPIYVCGPFF